MTFFAFCRSLAVRHKQCIQRCRHWRNCSIGILSSTSHDWNQTGPSVCRRFFSSTPAGGKTIEDVADYIGGGQVRNVVVMAGAGISTPSGIPDFRTPGTGLYDNLQKYDLPYAEAIFDIEYFHQNPKPFFALAKELYPSGQYRPNAAHYFVRLLLEKHLLLRMYTQNIDGLERLAGIADDKLIEAHGTFATATCQSCLKTYVASDIEQDIFEDKVPECIHKSCKGVVKPDIVFFGEQLPKKFFYAGVDMPRADLLIIIGTSLEVQPFAGIAEVVLPGVMRVLFNREAAGPFAYSPRTNDVLATGDLVTNVWKLCKLLDWSTELEDLIATCEADSKTT